MASLARPLTNRAVHLRITPRPSNLGESREILRLISAFGEVEYFKNLKYDALSAPTTALVIFKHEEAAMQCMKRSPIRFRMGKAAVGEEIAGPAPSPSPSPAPTTAPPVPASEASAVSAQHIPSRSGGAWGLGGQTRAMSTTSSYAPMDTLPNPPARPVRTPFQAPPLPLLESRIFQVQTNPAYAHFRDQINMGYYHGRFAIDSKSVPQTDLAQTVPLPGLSCVNWKAKERPWRLMNQEKERDRTGPHRRKSLRELYDTHHETAGTADFRNEALSR